MKKILFVTNTMGRAGAERCLIDMFKKIDTERYNVYLMSIIPRGEFFADVPSDIKILNTHYSEKSVNGKRAAFYIAWLILKSQLKNLHDYKKLIINIKKIIINRKLNLSHVFWEQLAKNMPSLNESYDLAVGFIEGAATYYVAEMINAKKKAAFVHVDYVKAGYKKEQDEYYYKKYDRIYGVSYSVCDTLKITYPDLSEKIEFFQNIVSEERIKEFAKKGKGFDDNFKGLRLLTIGRLHYQKGYDIAISSFAKFIKKYPNIDIRWYAMGDGELRNDLIKQIKMLGLKDRFILMGSKSNPYPYLAECDIYVHASRFEGWCIATAEARILAKPIITSETAGVREQLLGMAEIITLDEDELVDAIYNYAVDEERRNNLSKKILESSWELKDDIGKLYMLADSGD